MNVPILGGPTELVCPNCDFTTVVDGPAPGIGGGQSTMHQCTGLAGLLAPMIPKGTAAKVEAIEREDYVAGELVRTDDNGRPIMSVVTTRDEGQDCVVFASTATGSGRSS